MRYRLMATYRGVPYEVGIGPSNAEIVLFAACPPPEELGFEPATGHWRKPVIRAEIDALWESRPVGVYRGEPCIVLDDPGERLHIAYFGTDAEWATNLGYWQVDRGSSNCSHSGRRSPSSWRSAWKGHCTGAGRPMAPGRWRPTRTARRPGRPRRRLPCRLHPMPLSRRPLPR